MCPALQGERLRVESELLRDAEKAISLAVVDVNHFPHMLPFLSCHHLPNQLALLVEAVREVGCLLLIQSYFSIPKQ